MLRAHSEAIWVETERMLEIGEVRKALECAPGVVVVDDPAAKRYPMPLEVTGMDPVYVGRLRRDSAVVRSGEAQQLRRISLYPVSLYPIIFSRR